MSAQIRPSRKRSYIDPGVQGTLLRKLSFHWLVLIVVNCIVFGGWLWLFELADTSAVGAISASFSNCLPLIITSAALLPVFLFDTLRLTSRFAGPALRVRAALSDAAQGRPVRPLQFRQDDFWQEMAESFNLLIEKKEEAERIAQLYLSTVSTNDRASDQTDESESSSKCGSPNLRSADEALRLLDTIDS
jgi:hypothetical protein